MSDDFYTKEYMWSLYNDLINIYGKNLKKIFQLKYDQVHEHGYILYQGEVHRQGTIKELCCFLSGIILGGLILIKNFNNLQNVNKQEFSIK